MSKPNPTPVSGAFVREWLRSKDGQAALKSEGIATKVGTRGRHNPAQVAVFHAANPGSAYAEKSVAEGKSITLTLTKRDKNGKSRGKVDLAVPVSEVRSLGGAPAAGRLSSAVREKAVAALEAERGW